MKLQIVIDCDNTTGEFNVSAPFNNLGLCYSLLELARDVCKAEAEKLKVGVVSAAKDDIEKFGKHGMKS